MKTVRFRILACAICVLWLATAIARHFVIPHVKCDIDKDVATLVTDREILNIVGLAGVLRSDYEVRAWLRKGTPELSRRVGASVISVSVSEFDRSHRFMYCAAGVRGRISTINLDVIFLQRDRSLYVVRAGDFASASRFIMQENSGHLDYAQAKRIGRMFFELGFICDNATVTPFDSNSWRIHGCAAEPEIEIHGDDSSAISKITRPFSSALSPHHARPEVGALGR